MKPCGEWKLNQTCAATHMYAAHLTGIAPRAVHHRGGKPDLQAQSTATSTTTDRINAGVTAPGSMPSGKVARRVR